MVFVPQRFVRGINRDCVVNGQSLPKGATLGYQSVDQNLRGSHLEAVLTVNNQNYSACSVCF